ncbi:MAG TPA: hypothetical protein VEF04_16145 [Blastocatellia bacterium]|nr:hypothetical protein [Blastocatellia bacterium]
MPNVYKIRHESFEAAGVFHQAQSEFFITLSQGNATQIRQAAEKALLAGEFYKAALTRLLDGLTSPENIGVDKSEIMQTVQLLDALDKELSILAHRKV